MLDGAPISWWIGFHVVVLVLIVLDLAVLGRGDASSQTRRNFLFVGFLLVLAACFGVWIGHAEGVHFCRDRTAGAIRMDSILLRRAAGRGRATAVAREKEDQRRTQAGEMDYAVDQTLDQQSQGDFFHRSGGHRTGRSGIRD